MNVLITGATSGIGFELAKLYEQTGQHKLVLLGRKSLSDMASDIASDIDSSFFTTDNYYQLDLSKTHEEQKALGAFEKLSSFLTEQKIDHLDLVIHNAGAALYGPSHLHNDDTLQDLLSTNLQSPIALSHQLLPLVQKNNGKLVFISSVAAHLATADYAEYVASKAALEGFARSLRAEDDVRVQIIRPGATKTDIFSKAGISSEQVNPSSFSSVEDVAASIYRSVNASDLDTTIQVSNKVLSFIGRFFSPVLDRLMRFSEVRKNKAT